MTEEFIGGLLDLLDRHQSDEEFKKVLAQRALDLPWRGFAEFTSGKEIEVSFNADDEEKWFVRSFTVAELFENCNDPRQLLREVRAEMDRIEANLPPPA